MAAAWRGLLQQIYGWLELGTCDWGGAGTAVLDMVLLADKQILGSSADLQAFDK